MITPEQFKSCFPNNKEPEAWAAALNAVLPRYDITTTDRIVHFLAQCGHESEGFTAVKENLNYSAAALTATWPKRFPPSISEQYARKPEKIGNRAYADRMGNGPEESGDGFKHRGRGVIQLTGKDNYKAFAKATGKSYDEIFAYLETKAGAVESACWYWKGRNINPKADANNVEGITRAINGGLNGLADRKARTEKIRGILS